MNIIHLYLAHNLKYPNIPSYQQLNEWILYTGKTNIYFYLCSFSAGFQLFNDEPLEIRYNHFNKILTQISIGWPLIKKQWISLYLALLSYHNGYNGPIDVFIRLYNNLITQQYDKNDLELNNAICRLEVILMSQNINDEFKWRLIDKINSYSHEIINYNSQEQIVLY